MRKESPLVIFVTQNVETPRFMLIYAHVYVFIEHTKFSDNPSFTWITTLRFY